MGFCDESRPDHAQTAGSAEVPKLCITGHAQNNIFTTVVKLKDSKRSLKGTGLASHGLKTIEDLDHNVS